MGQLNANISQACMLCLCCLQVGSSQWFDLVDYDKLPPGRTFRVRKLTQFSDFKQQVGGGQPATVVLVNCAQGRLAEAEAAAD